LKGASQSEASINLAIHRHFYRLHNANGDGALHSIAVFMNKPLHKRQPLCQSQRPESAFPWLVYRNKASTPCGNWLACATMAVPACCSTCARLRLAVSAAKSASVIRLREAVRFSPVACRLSMVELKRF
jgi:hypothetical protein